MARISNKLKKITDVNIHTMHDDLRGKTDQTEKKEKQAPPKQKPAPQVLQKVIQDKSNIKKPIRRKKRHIIKKTFAVISSIIIIAGIGVATWLFMQWTAGEKGKGSQGIEYSAAELIPQDALLVLQYQLQREEDRAALAAMWESIDADQEETNRISALASGDPRLLLEDSAIKEFFYVLISSDTRPFILIPKTQRTSELFTEQTSVQVLEKGNWYIIHSLSTTPYEVAIATGSMEAAGGLPVADQSFNMRFIMSANLATQIYNSIAGNKFAVSEMQPIIMYVDSLSDNNALHISGRLQDSMAETGLQETEINPELYSMVPDDAEYAIFGNNFANDASSWQDDELKVDLSILTQPSVQQLISELNNSYVLYRRNGKDGAEDIGLLITLPSSLQKNLKIDDVVVEKAVSSLLPLIIGQTSKYELAFNKTIYEGVPLRYVNMRGNTHTVDYTIGDNYILITSSKEGAYTLTDTLSGTQQSIKDALPWSDVLNKGGEILTGKKVIIGSTNHASLVQFLPTQQDNVPVGIAINSTKMGTKAQGVLLMNDTSF